MKNLLRKVTLPLVTMFALVAVAPANTITLNYEDAAHISGASNPSLAQLTAAAVVLNGGVASSYLAAFSNEIYKDTTGTDTGDAAGWYTTTYVPNAEGTAKIEWIGPGFIEGTYLLAKDGNEGHYLWDVSGWNGTDTILIPNPWLADNGKAKAFSHVTIWGGEGTTRVPDQSSTSLLIALGLASLLAVRRRS